MQTAATAKQEQREQTAGERLRPRPVYRPGVDIVDGPTAVTLVVDLPGVGEGDVDVSLEKDVLTVRGRVEPPTYDGFTPTGEEYGVGDFERSFTVSSEIDRNAIEAVVKDGVLRVRLPKSAQVSTKIPVSTG